MYFQGMVILIALAVFVCSTYASSQSSYACGACMMLVNEIESDISKIDPKKMIEAGSFRVDPDGEQSGKKQVPYGRSNSHILELLEIVCSKSKDYQLVVNRNTGKAVFINKNTSYLKGEANSRVSSRLHDACNDFIDSYEDEITLFHSKFHEEPVKELCHLRLGICTSVDVSPLPSSEPEEIKNTKEEEEEERDEL